MPITIHQEDIIPQIKLPSEETLERQATSLQGCISFLSVLQVCYQVSGDNIIISHKLLGVELGSVTLNSKNPTAKIGGSVDSIGAEVTFTLHLSPLSLEICGEVKYIVGSKSGCTTVNF